MVAVFLIVFVLRLIGAYIEFGKVDIFASLLLILGWFVGYLLLNIEKYLNKSLIVNNRSAVKNVLTGMVVTILALGMVMGVGSLLGVGVVTALMVRMYCTYLMQKNKDEWYWMFAKSFSVKEKQYVTVIWGVVVGLVLLKLL